MNDWFVVDQGHRSGPFSFEVLAAKVLAKEVSVHALVWKKGLDGWEPVCTHFQPGSDEHAVMPEITEVIVPPTGNSVIRYWRGQYRLALSFWLVGVFGLALLLYAITLYTIIVDRQGFNPYLALIVVAPGWLFCGAFEIFHLVGTWRSARRHFMQAGDETLAGILVWAAQTAAVGGIVVYVILFAMFGYPKLAESWGIAFQNDPNIPAYSLRVMRGGTELELAGGIKYGLARETEAILNANPRIKLIHLNSVGGSLAEAEKLATLIRSRNLETYSASECASACTIAFAAGSWRWLKKGASLGYHAASFGGDESGSAMSHALIRQGVDKNFAERAGKTSSESIWYPNEKELKSAGIISGYVDAYKFAASGLGTSQEMDEALQQLLSSLTVFRIMDKSAPKLFKAAVTDARRGYLSGLSEGELLDQMKQTHVTPYLKEGLARADIQVLVDFTEFFADELDYLRHIKAVDCFELAIFQSRAVVSDDSEAFSDREERLLTEILKAPVSSSWESQVSSIEFLRPPDRMDPPEYDQYCQLAVTRAREVSKLPKAEAAAIGRYLVMKIYGR